MILKPIVMACASVPQICLTGRPPAGRRTSGGGLRPAAPLAPRTSFAAQYCRELTLTKAGSKATDYTLRGLSRCSKVSSGSVSITGIRPRLFE